MRRKMLALVPSTLPSSVNLERFQPDATEVPFLSIVSWTFRVSADSRRSRQLALDKNKCQLLELQKLQPVKGLRSWFVGNNVVQDGGMIIFTPVDALFVLLDAVSTRFSSVYDVLSPDGNTWLLQLSTLRQEVIEMICDVQVVGDEEGIDNLLVRINESKVTRWLKDKVENAALVLATHELEVYSKSRTTINEQVNLPGSTKNEKKLIVTQKDITKHYREAIEVVGDYLSEEWVNVLYNSLNVKKEVEVKIVAKLVPQDTFKRFDLRQACESGPKRLTPSSAGGTKKKSKLDNVDRSGMKSLTSFFGKK